MIRGTAGLLNYDHCSYVQNMQNLPELIQYTCIHRTIQAIITVMFSHYYSLIQGGGNFYLMSTAYRRMYYVYKPGNP